MSQANNRMEEHSMGEHSMGEHRMGEHSTDERRVLKFVAAGLVIIGLLLAGNAVQNAAWTQGYTLGLLTSGADGADLAPYLIYRAGPGLGRGIGFFGGVARLFFVALLAVGFLKLFGFGYHRRHGGSPPWARHYSPWCGESMKASAVDDGSAVESTDAPQRPAPVHG